MKVNIEMGIQMAEVRKPNTFKKMERNICFSKWRTLRRRNEARKERREG